MDSDEDSSDILIIESEKPAILVVAPNDDLVRQLERVLNPQSGTALSKAGYIIHWASSSATAFEQIREEVRDHSGFPLVFVEYQLEGGNGLDIIKALWQLDPCQNAVLCTAETCPEWQQVVSTLGETDQLLILQEPFIELELRQIVHAMTRQWQLVKQTQSVMQYIEQQNEQLAASNRKLQEMQAQLLQSEKMSSIGQLAAGIAHEINNPLGFVMSNLNTFEQYTENFLTLIAAYENAETKISCNDTLTELQDLKHRIDIDYLRSDAPDLLKESTDGIDRVKKIVQDLKEFSHPEQNADILEFADLHDGLESALNIVHNELKYKAEIVKNYAPLPLINCTLSQLIQVFVNMLINAAQAITDHGVITISTGTGTDRVWVEIADSGCGIPEDKLNKIFDPFFTTKPVGKGTGLGLSISYGIIKKHHGDISVVSSLGQGTTFRIDLPINT
jgi:two-component system, NtrC family, sensor kinase